ncbi:L-lactate dehydrogenase [Nanchangia anserum]|uniref:L-lactate dehydrogenase n=1 Tax=Nanchangia anserum TaxID=2692125 RepID=A0A8I0GDI1_9ACTO|nr:L-lactate dehydrogenase [Nanchangia anserum]MBD3690256.1 L-lactate dehydrogenase [Nanchangia anserum]
MSTERADTLYPTRRLRPSKISIVGAGAVGTALAYACVIKGVARDVVLYDIAKDRVEAEALDIAHGIQFTPVGSIVGSDDVEAMRDSDMIIITAGPKQKPGQSRLELAGATAAMLEKMIPSLLNVAPDALYLMVTNPVDVATYIALKISGLPRTQIFGSGTVLDTSRLRYLVSQATGVAVRNIHAYIAGEHGDSEVALWSCAEIGNVPVSRWGATADGRPFDDEIRSDIAHQVVRSAYTIIDGKGATNYAIGLAASNIINAALRDEERVLTISTLLDGWAGISGVCMAAPTIVGIEGAGRVLEPPMTLDEREALSASALALRHVTADLGY